MRSLTEGLEDKTPAEETGGSGGGLRETINTLASGPAGKALLALIALGMIGFFVVRLQSATGAPPETIVEPRVRVMNPLTGELKWHMVRVGAQVDEGYYPVEYCWNNHNGDGVPVILNTRLFPINDARYEEPTSCPCCGVTVVARNPKPEEFIGQTPTDYDSGQADPCVVDHYAALLGG